MEIDVFSDLAVSGRRFIDPDEILFIRICRNGKRTFNPDKALVCSEKFAKKFKTWLSKNEDELYPFRVAGWSQEAYEERLAQPFKFDEDTRKNFEEMEGGSIYLKVKVIGKPKPYNIVDNATRLSGMREIYKLKNTHSYWISI